MMFLRQNFGQLFLCSKANFDGIWSQKMVGHLLGRGAYKD